MIPALRKEFNKQFTPGKYQAFLDELNSLHPGVIEFRVAETGIYVPRDFIQKILHACESIVDVITGPEFMQLTADAVPGHLNVYGENRHTHFICFDFGICVNDHGEYEPQLIEMQGFPSLFAYEILLDDIYRKHFPVPENFSACLSGLDKDSYTALLNKIIVGDHNPENVILLEIFPDKQKTRIDFFCTHDYTGVRSVCLTELIKEGESLYYRHEGRKIRIERIYNRLIFDDLQQHEPEIREKGRILFEKLDVEWITHPNWFYRISKYTLPLIDHPYVPKTFFLNKIKQAPADLENYVLKPLFSFAGQGVIIDLKPDDLAGIPDPENWILQRKVRYADVIETPDSKAKAEIRIFYFWEDGKPRPIAAHNLARLSKGKMIGVRYNKDKDWVGGTICYFENHQT